MGVPVRLFGARWNEPWRNRVYALNVAWSILKNRRKYDFVYFLMPGLHLALGLVAARLVGKPGIMKVGGSGILPVMAKSWLGRLELRWLRKWATRVLILNQDMQQEGLNAGFPREQLMWMPNPVDVEDFAPCSAEDRMRIRERLRLPADALVVVYVGRLAPEKALESLIEGFAIASRRIPQARLLLVGDGPLRASLEALASKLDCRGVIFGGRKSVAEVRECLQASDAFALVSFAEGFSCALVEAMSVGLPAIVSNIPANTQLVEDGVHGFASAVGDPRSIAAAMEKLLSDTGAHSQMGARARQRVVENYSSEQISWIYEALFDEVMKAR